MMFKHKKSTGFISKIWNKYFLKNLSGVKMMLTQYFVNTDEMDRVIEHFNMTIVSLAVALKVNPKLLAKAMTNKDVRDSLNEKVAQEVDKILDVPITTEHKTKAKNKK